MDGIKIAFTGTHGTGKTTLTYQVAAEFRKRGHNVEMLKEVARESPLPINERTTPDAQRWILFRQMSLELELGARSDVLVCDRSVLDNYAYLRRAFGAQETLERYLAEWMRTYDEVVHVPVTDARIAADGVRSTDREFQVEIDRIVRDLFAAHAIPYLALESVRHSWLATLIARFEARGFLAPTRSPEEAAA
jgi:nicotinamide riboside kinase